MSRRPLDREGMSRAARSLFAFGVYLVGLGLLLLFVPNLILQFFAVRPTNEVWIRINGMFVLCLAFFYVQAARHNSVKARYVLPKRRPAANTRKRAA